MTINAADFSIDTSANLRHVSGTTVYPILDLHAWLQDLADNAAPSGDDNVSTLGANPSQLAGKRLSTRPMAITLLNSVNVDDTTARRFNYGSIEQAGGNVLYTGIKTVGSIVAASPIYIIQSDAKVSAWWSNGHIQILLKAKTGGALIAGNTNPTVPAGSVTVYSRKYGQSYSHFDLDLSAGSEQIAALSTALDSNIDTSTMTPAVCASYFATAIGGTGGASPKIALAFGDTTQDLGGGQGSLLHKGTITLDGTVTLAQAYQALMWACSENSTITINSIPGYKYRQLNAAYTETSDTTAAPFGKFAGGKFFFAQGWWVTGVQAGDAKNYTLTSHTGVTETPPNAIQVSVGGLVAGDYVIVARDNGSGGFLNDTTVATTATVGATSVTLTAAPSDTPTGASVIRINGNAHTYTSRSGNTVSGLSPAVPAGGYTAGTQVFFPFIDGASAGASMTSASFQYAANFTCRYRVRNGGGTPIQPFESTLAVTSTGGSGTAVRNLDT